MKYSREIRVGILAVVAILILYFGFNFLKGVNIFAPIHTYVGTYQNINGLTAQAPVYIRGYKVGQVDRIQYDFTKEEAFTVVLSIDKTIILPEGTELALIADGLLGGTALQLNVPTGDATPYYTTGDTLPTIVVPGLFDVLEDGLLASLQGTIAHIDSLILGVQAQLDGDHMKNTLAHIDVLTADLAVTSAKLKGLMHTQVPTIVNDAESAVGDLKTLAANLSEVDIQATMQQVDTTLAHINAFTAKLNSTDGTVGMLLNDKKLYLDLTSTVNSADSLLVDLKANPKRYVHFSLFGAKEKKTK